jgi:hypothetical protein
MGPLSDFKNGGTPVSARPANSKQGTADERHEQRRLVQVQAMEEEARLASATLPAVPMVR